MPVQVTPFEKVYDSGSAKAAGAQDALAPSSGGNPQVVAAPLRVPTTPRLPLTPTPGRETPPMPRIEDFDPAKALASGVWYHPDLPEDQVRAKMVEYLSNKALAEKRRAVNWAQQNNQLVREEKPDGSVTEIMKLEPDGTPVYYSTQNVEAALSLQTNLVRDTSPYSVNGSNGTGRFNIGEWDGGSVRASHKSLTGRITQKEGTITLSDHATHVAGTLAGSYFYPSLLGMAPSAAVLSYDFTNDAAEMTAEAQTTAAISAKVLVSNHSYGRRAGWEGNQYYGAWLELEDRRFGQYDSQAALIDSICLNAPYYQPFFAAGNPRNNPAPATGATFQRFTSTPSGVIFQNNPQAYNPAVHPGPNNQNGGGFDTIATYNGAKNVITVGAVTDALNTAGNRSVASATMSSFSGWGPTDDGRIKPDIVAVGVNVLSASSSADDTQTTKQGTSMASPNACGSAMLLQELYSDNFSGVAMRASTLKALIIHTADDMGNAGPDYTFGWGLMNTKKAADLILAHKNAPANNHMIEEQLTTTQASRTYTFAWDGAGPIRVTICWTDAAGAAQSGLDSSTATLVNDLDLRVTGPGGTTNPYTLNPASPGTAATTGDNVRDNVEQVYIAAPTAGTYTVTVNHKGALTGVNGRQNFALIHSGLRADAPVIKLSTNQITLSTSPSSSPDFQSFDLQNTGGRALNYNITDDASWLHVNPVSGSLSPNETDTIFLGFTTTLLTSGVYTGRVRITGNGVAPAEVEVRLTVTGNTVPLAQALDTPNTVTSSGSAPWYGQTALTHDSADAARSAPVKDSQDTAFSMNVQGPGELKFWWKVDSEVVDRLSFEIGTTMNQQISGNQDWAEVTVLLNPGTQKLTWRYRKDGSTAVGADAGWVDQVRYVPYGTNLRLTQTRLDLITTLGVNPPGTSFDVLNEGFGTINYTITSSKPWVVLSPNSGSTSGEPDNIGITFNATTLKAGLNTARVTVVPAFGSSQFFDVNLTVLPATSVPLHTALDFGTATSWNTNTAPAGWFGQSVEAFDKTDCARSSTSVADNANSSLLLPNINGPGTITFQWRADSEPGYDFLIFMDGLTEVARTSGTEQPWRPVSYSFGPGAHTFIWKYSKDHSEGRGLDCGFVDKVVIDLKAPQLNVSTTSLLGSGLSGGTPGGPSFTINNTGAGTLNYALASDQTWCKLSTAKGSATTETDTINVSFDARSLIAGEHDATITVNGGTAGTRTINVHLSLGQGTVTPVTVSVNSSNLQGFSNSALPGAVNGWGFYSSNEGRIAIVSGALRMDDRVTGSLYSLNEGILHANLLGQTGAYLSFKHRQSNDEPNTLPDSFMNHANGDGVSISADGITWHTVDQLQNTDGNFTTHLVDLDAAVAAASIAYTADFQIKFQQYDDCSWGTDGAEFDDVMITLITTPDDHAGTFAGATVVPTGGTPVNGKIELPGDQDMFSFTLFQEGALTVGTTGGTDTFGELFDSTGGLIASNNDTVGKNFFLGRVLDAGTYYVRVRGFNNAKGLYSIVTNFRLTSAPPMLSLPASDWTPLSYSPFVPPFYEMTANGLLKQGQGASLVVLGGMSVKVTKTRSFTGRVFWEGVSYPLVGSFPLGAGAVSGSVARKGLSSLNFTLEYHNEGTIHSEWRMLGSVTDGITTANAVLLEDYNWESPAFAGLWSIAMPSVDNGSTSEPQGTGYGYLLVNGKNGDATFFVNLPDNTTASAATFVTAQHNGEPEISFYVPAGLGFYAGEMRFRDLLGISDLDGRVSWRKVPNAAKGAFYPAGFHVNRSILGCRYTAQPNLPDLPGLSPFGPGGTSYLALVTCSGSDLPFLPGLRALSWDIKDKLSCTATSETWTCSLSAPKAQVTGSFKHAASGVSFNFGGSVFQKQQKVVGFLKGLTQSGPFVIHP